MKAAIADRATQRAEGAVVGDERGQRWVGALDHTRRAEIGELPRPAPDIREQVVDGIRVRRRGHDRGGRHRIPEDRGVTDAGAGEGDQ